MAAQKYDYVDGYIPDTRTLGAWFQMSMDEIVKLRDMAVTRHVLDYVSEGRYRVHNWEEWRDVKDKGAVKRKRAERQRKKQVKENEEQMSRPCHEDVTAMSRPSIQHSAFNSQPPAPNGNGVDEVVEFGRVTMGDRFDLEAIGEKLAGWRAMGHPDDWIKDAILVANCSAKPNLSCQYINGCLRRWKTRGSVDPEEMKRAKKEPEPPIKYHVAPKKGAT